MMKFRHIVHYGWYFLCVLVWILFFVGILYISPTNWLPQKRLLRVLTFGNVLDPAYVRQFEKKTGISVQLSYYASNEELQVKLKKTHGAGYDLIVPSDYAIPLLRQQDLLKPLNKQKMPFFNTINPLLLNHSFDEHNEYSVPFSWELYGLGIDTRVLKLEPHQARWDFIFKDPMGISKIIMTNDPIEAVMCAAQYLYGSHIEWLTDEQQKTIQMLLHTQNRWVEAYASTRAGYYLATGNSAIALTTSAAILTAQKYAPYLAFVRPIEGGFVTIEHFALPRLTEHEEEAYQFMEFMFTSAAALYHYQAYGNFPALLDDEILNHVDGMTQQFLTLPKHTFTNIKFFQRALPEDQVSNLWVTVKS